MPLTKDIIKVARCENIDWDAGVGKGACEKIVAYQGISPSSFKDEYQLPEPFSGEIDKAKYLIIGSNPAYKKEETPFPRYSWNDKDIASFFYDRMSSYSNKGHLTGCKKVISWITGYGVGNIKNEEIALSDIVHCKSNKEAGVSKACSICAEKHLEHVLGLFNGKYIILLGSKIQDCLDKNKTVRDILKEAEKRGVRIVKARHPKAHFSNEKKEEYVQTSFNTGIWWPR